MAWVEQRGTRWRVRFRNTDGSVGTDSSHPTRNAAELRCKQVDIDQAYDTYLDPGSGRIPRPMGHHLGIRPRSRPS